MRIWRQALGKVEGAGDVPQLLEQAALLRSAEPDGLQGSAEPGAAVVEDEAQTLGAAEALHI